MNISNMKVSDIRPYEKNPRLNEGAVDAVAASTILWVFITMYMV